MVVVVSDSNLPF